MYFIIIDLLYIGIGVNVNFSLYMNDFLILLMFYFVDLLILMES